MDTFPEMHKLNGLYTPLDETQLVDRMMFLAQTNEGDFIQTRYRAASSNVPPPIFYRGRHFDVTRINLLDLSTFKWRTFNDSNHVCAEAPEITEEVRLSVIPYLTDEPFFKSDIPMPSLKLEEELSITKRYYDGTYGIQAVVPDDRAVLIHNVTTV